MNSLKVLCDGREYRLELEPDAPEQSLLQLIYLSGIFEPPPLCAGISLCGRCRVRFLAPDASEAATLPQEEAPVSFKSPPSLLSPSSQPFPSRLLAPAALPEDVQALGQELVDAGWRLACRHRAKAGLRLALPDGIRLLADFGGVLKPDATPLAREEDEGGAGNAGQHDIVKGAACPNMATAQSAMSTAPENIQFSVKAKNFEAPQKNVSLKNVLGVADAKKDEVNSAHAKTAKTEQCLAVDFGSTSLFFFKIGANGPERAKKAVNPQIGAGSDIVSRLAFASRKTGLRRLSSLSQAALGQMLGADREKVGLISLAANPAMVYLLLGLDVSSLATAPYRLGYRGGTYENLPGLPKIWVAPLIGPFVGGDLSAGYAALAWGRKAEYPFLLADMGTNGEFILALSEQQAFAASLPLGPALEGIGMRCGSEARPGVITGFNLSPAGLVPQFFAENDAATQTRASDESAAIAGNTAVIKSTAVAGQSLDAAAVAVGLSGTAYLALANLLVRQQLIEESGLFASAPPASPLAARLWGQIKNDDAGRAFYLAAAPPRLASGSLYMSGADIEELLKVKAAFSLALKLLLAKAGLRFTDLAKFYLAGSLGANADLSALEGLGFLPPGGSAKSVAVGNSSLDGATLLCQRPALREKLTSWAGKVQVLELSESENFQSAYTSEMRFKW